MRIALSKRAQPKLALMVILSAGCTATGALLPGNTARAQQPKKALYTPAKEDYLPEYERDPANGKVQTWDQYWGWVRAFYAGNLLSDGWTKHGERNVAGIKSGDNRQALIEKYNELGRIVSREWAKDYAIRKITTADLRRWHETVTEAVRSDDGSGEKIKKALGKVREQAEKQLAIVNRAGSLAVSGLVEASVHCGMGFIDHDRPAKSRSIESTVIGW
jgi:hypothetical protein